MPGPRLKIESSLAEPTLGVKLIRLAGVLDAGTSSQFETEFLRSVLPIGRPRLILDFSEVDFISSAGWGILIGHVKRFRQREGDIRLVGIKSRVKHSFELLVLDNHFRVFETAERALAEPW